MRFSEVRACGSNFSMMTLVTSAVIWRALVNPSRRTRTTCDRESRIAGTSGEIFSDGSAIELVKSATDRHLQLLFWRNQQNKVAPQIEHRGRLYQVPDADETLLQAIRFPSDALDYGTAQKLFAEVCEVFARYIGLAFPEAAP